MVDVTRQPFIQLTHLPGKSTLLDLMAFRKTPLEGASVSFPFHLKKIPSFMMIDLPQVNLNGKTLGARSMQQMSTFVEQEDALLGVLTVRESVSFALRLQ
jgi:ABC-type nitrate/sulfonate/bicarbonate transport system ATPase subunit